MNRIKKTIAILSLVVLTGVSMNVGATNWKMVQEANNSSEITEYVDLDSIQKIDNKSKKAWVKLVRSDNDCEVLLLGFSKDGKVRLLDYVETGDTNMTPSVSTDWTYVTPDSFEEKAYNQVWSLKERNDVKKKSPNRWERKGEDTVDRAANRVINKMLRHIGW